MRVARPICLLLGALALAACDAAERPAADASPAALERPLAGAAEASPPRAEASEAPAPAARPARTPLPADTPSLLLVTIDTLRADHVGVYGDADAATPTLDTLAARGTRFTRAFSVAPLTVPAHASLMTGLIPPHHGVRHNGLYVLPREARTLAETLSAAGWRTGAVVGSGVLARRYGLDQGFDDYDDEAARASTTSGFLERRAEQVVDRALAWLDRDDAPFFLWLHFYDPHSEYAPPPPFDERFAARPYDGEIAYTDAQLGRLLDGLRARGRLAHTVVAVTADHGESLGEHGEPTHGYTLYDATLHVPLLLAGPGVPSGRVEPELASLVDVAPTVLALLGRAPMAERDGLDLLAAHGKADGGSGRVLYAETLAGRIDHGWSELFAARSASHLYVRAPRPELYDVAADPAEVHDLLAGGTAATDLQATAQQLDAAIGVRLAASVASRTAPLDETTRAQLRMLGYAVPDAPRAETGLDPKDGLARLRLYWEAGRAFDARDLPRARTLAGQAAAALPDSPEVQSLLAQIALESGDAGGALEHARHAADLEPRAARPRAFIGDALAALGRSDEAASAYAEALRLDPYLPRAHMGRVRLAARTGDRDALARYEAEARRAGAHDAELLLGLAFVWERLDDRERALARSRDALAVAPDLGAAHMSVAIELAALGREDESDQALARAGDAAGVPALRNRLAIAHARAGRVERARAIWRDLVARYPDYASPRRNLEHLEAVASARTGG